MAKRELWVELDTLSDEILCERYRETGEQEILVVLLDRYDRMLLALARPFLPFLISIEDFKQDLFLHLHRQLEQVKPRVFKHWLYRIARNRLQDMRKKKQAEVREVLPDQPIDFQEGWDLGLDSEHIHQAMTQLKPDQHLYLELVFFQDYKPRELMVLLDWPEQQTRLVYQNARRRMRKILQGYGEEYQAYFEQS